MTLGLLGVLSSPLGSHDPGVSMADVNEEKGTWGTGRAIPNSEIRSGCHRSNSCKERPSRRHKGRENLH